jgi:hypothetical protein
MDRNASADEAAAIAAAIVRFETETAAVAPAGQDAASAWQRAALAEGVGAKATLQQHLEGGSQWQS